MMNTEIARFTDNTLYSMTKAQLIAYIRDLEHNWRAAEDCCNNQAELLKILTKDIPCSELE